LSQLIDISPTLTPDIAVWPGDVPFSRSVALDMGQGDNLTLSSITTTVHVGAHTDAPSHYGRQAPGIGERPLSRYYGPCEVIAVDVGLGQRILPRHLPGAVKAERVLFRTQTFPDPNQFNRDFASLSPELVDHLADQGVLLVGLDTPSIDLFDDAVLLSHNAVLRRDLAVLEGIVLDHVLPGLYTLIALPLKIAGCDASPVRAVLLGD
jgi:arylformamidase